MSETVRLSEVSGIMVISRSEGAHLGFVERVLIDPMTSSMATLTFRHSRLTPEQAVPASAVVAFGRDVVFIDSEAAARAVEDGVDDSHRTVRDLLGLFVTTQNGTRLGTLAGVGVTVGDWQIAELYLAGGRVMAVKADHVTVGRDEILVPVGSALRITGHGGDHGIAILGHLLRVDGLALALQGLTQTPAARAVRRATKSAPGLRSVAGEKMLGGRVRVVGSVTDNQPND
ncbi:MAG: hypothetical protein HY903_16735 [Deltaproteobacteria bacterium]|nr:hypothetical protein [Deltaproteobacteria bacterium]